MSKWHAFKYFPNQSWCLISESFLGRRMGSWCLRNWDGRGVLITYMKLLCICSQFLLQVYTPIVFFTLSFHCQCWLLFFLTFCSFPSILFRECHLGLQCIQWEYAHISDLLLLFAFLAKITWWFFWTFACYAIIFFYSLYRLIFYLTLQSISKSRWFRVAVHLFMIYPFMFCSKSYTVSKSTVE